MNKLTMNNSKDIISPSIIVKDKLSSGVIIGVAAILSLGSLFLSGCLSAGGGFSPSAHYYRLELPAVSQNNVTTPATPSAEKVLIKVRTSEAIKGPRIVQATSDYELSYLELHRWAEPINRGVGRLLASELLPFFADVKAAPTESGYVPSLRVEVVIEKLWGTPRGEVVLDARWTITDAREVPLAQGREVFRQKGWNTGDYQNFAERISRMMTPLAKAINESISLLDAAKKNY